MPRAIMRNGEIHIIKSEGDINNEFNPVLEEVRREVIDALALDDAGKLTEVREKLRGLLLERDERLALARLEIGE